MNKTKIINDMIIKYFPSIREGPGIGRKIRKSLMRKI